MPVPYQLEMEQQSNVISIQSWTADHPLQIALSSSADLEHAARQLMSYRSVEVNLEPLDRALAQRALRFLSGVVYAMDGCIERMDHSHFFISMRSAEIRTADSTPETSVWEE